ncbi:MAG TPA: type I methionyl aminopeptidase [Actinomycetota bacterium]|nr:type I methionyl aminopeptidase [Actinomycetota bacterium]
MIIRKTPEQLEKMARSGRVLAEVIREMGEQVRPGVTLKELDQMAERSMRLRGAVPSFLGYRGFPASICASPNEMVVHGIPDGRKLNEGDIFSADFGLILDGWHADSAYTFPVGTVSEEARKLLEVTRAALAAGIACCRPGNRLGDIGYAIQQVVERAGFSIVREFVGHGIGRSMHEDPQVPNYGKPGRGPVLEEGWVLAIEPMVNTGGWETKLLADNWSVVTADGSLSAHFEHTVAVTADGARILTAL